MKASAKNLTDLLLGTDRYAIPLYQRQYVWLSQPDQPENDRLGPYWADVKETVDAYLQRAQAVAHFNGDETRVSAVSSHFFGALVIDQPTKDGGITTQEVIDGQQRLTTTLLFLAAATELCEGAGLPRHASRLRKLWQQDDDLDLSGLSRFKLSPTRKDQEAFLTVMEGKSSVASGTRIQQAYEFFRGVLAEWARDIPVGEERSYFDALRDTINEHLMFVDIRLEVGDNAQGIFESLNAQGEKLLAMDLVKNEVFRKAKRLGSGIDLDELDREVWTKRFPDDWWREPVRQGRYVRPRAELFLMHWLIDQKSGDVSATALYVEFQNIAKAEMNDPADVKGFIAKFIADADRFRDLESLPEGSLERRFFARLQVVDTAVLYPLILRLWRWKDNSLISIAELQKSLAALESWLIRRAAVVPNSTKNYNNVVVALLRLVGTAERPVDRAVEALIGYLRESDDATRYWPSDDEFLTQLSRREFYKKQQKGRDNFFLRTIEEKLRSSKKSEATPVASGLTIEHVIPQSWREHWPLESLDDDEAVAAAEERREERIHRLGNLSLVNGSLNPSMGKSPWLDKREQLLEHSTLLLNADLVTNSLYREKFDENSIDERGERLAKLLLDEWPGPDSIIWKEIPNQ